MMDKDLQPTLSGMNLSEIDWDAATRRMRFLIETNHMTVPDVAHDLGIKQTTLQEILDGAARPSEYLIVAAANYFGVSVDFLVSDGSERNRPGAQERTASSSLSSATASSLSSATAFLGTEIQGISAKKPRQQGVTISDLAVRHQALVELLIEKSLFSAGEYNSAVARISERTRG